VKGRELAPEQASQIRKRSIKAVRHTTFSKYGTSYGILENREGIRVCGLICMGWPAWGLVAKNLGWRIKVIVTKGSRWTRWIARWFPETQLMEYESWDPFGTHLEGISLWISDVNLPRQLPVYNVKPCPLLLTMRRIRHNLSEVYEYQYITLNHSDCGGVSDGSWSFPFYHLRPWTQIKTLEPKAGRDMLSIIDCKKEG
jgi:hypothetical protein